MKTTLTSTTKSNTNRKRKRNRTRNQTQIENEIENNSKTKSNINSKTNRKRNETGYVTNVDIRGISPCLFPSKRNPITVTTCNEGFQTIDLKNNSDMPDDALINIYYSALGLLGVYILFKMYEKKLKLE